MKYAFHQQTVGKGKEKEPLDNRQAKHSAVLASVGFAAEEKRNTFKNQRCSTTSQVASAGFDISTVLNGNVPQIYSGVP